MTRVRKVLTGTYDGKPFELLDSVVHTEGTEYTTGAYAFVIELLEGGKKYVLDYDPLLKFDPIRRED